MKANELRIGNWINISFRNHDRKGDYQIVASQILDLFSNGEKSSFIYKPIPLTEEWLLKFGFEQQIGFIKFIGEPYQKDSFEVALNDVGKWYCYYRNFVKGKVDDFVLLKNDLKHVHQLQNLFYALCGEELTIKQ